MANDLNLKDTTTIDSDISLNIIMTRMLAESSQEAPISIRKANPESLISDDPFLAGTVAQQ